MSGTSPAPNRVAPTGEIIAVAGRGTWMGNRGRLHEGRGTRRIVRDFRVKTWIICELNFRNRRVAQWDPTRYTPLFFFDEAVALAAGHRPCGECRHAAYKEYRNLWSETNPGSTVSSREIDAQLHVERTGRERLELAWRDVPDGAFVMAEGGPAVVADDLLSVFDRSSYSYTRSVSRPTSGRATVLTPASSVEILRAGYRLKDPSPGADV